MKLQQRIIAFPLIIMIGVVTLCLFGIEYQLKHIWREQVNKELSTLARSSLLSIKYLHDEIIPTAEQNVLSDLASDITHNQDLRLTIFNPEQELVADSELSIERFGEMRGLFNADLTAAQANQTSLVQRYSEYWQQPAVFWAQYDRNTGYYAVVSLTQEHYQHAITSLRFGFFSVALIGCFVLIAFGSFISKLINQAVDSERRLQDIRIEQKTYQISLIQKMTTMINAAKNYDEVAQVIHNIMPKLIPSMSGKLYLIDGQGKLDELAKWGDKFSDNVTVLARKCREQQSNRVKSNNGSPAICTESQCPLSSHLICVDLVDDDQLFGVMHFIGEKHIVRDKKVRKVVIQLSEQVSLGITNLRVKNLLRQQAIRDPLTNLYNRRYMLEGFEQARNRAERHDYNLAVLMIDLDHFKTL